KPSKDHSLCILDDDGYFERYDIFTKTEFEKFLRNTCKKFGKVFMILDRAPQHRAKDIKVAVEELGDQVILKFLPPGCPDLNAIEELWRQLKMNVLSGPYINMYDDVDKWLEYQLPSLNICNYLYRSI
ncbi:MAG: hypothetical protein F4245_02800, partial [Cenarchaeum sp. SB0678_bin_8]|nr:hypothetical protein [Cenarchaeum sp. SB0678_bin_8]